MGQTREAMDRPESPIAEARQGPDAASSRRTRRPAGGRARYVPASLSSLVGRDEEISGVIEGLDGSRLVTLTGAPGIGKSRLALEVADELGEGDREGARFVELASLPDPAGVPSAVASAFSLSEIPGRSATEALIAYLRERTALLVLDNCEHLLGACAQLVNELLRGCPQLKVLATSREPLRLVGEHVWHVPPLALPEDGDRPGSFEALCASPAVRLFVERASAVQPGFALDEHAAPVAEICRRLDGIPLAIELAAARVELLTPGEIVWRLEDRFALLTSTSPVAVPRALRSGVKRMQVTRRRSRPGRKRRYARTVRTPKGHGKIWVRVFDGAGNASRWRAARRR